MPGEDVLAAAMDQDKPVQMAAPDGSPAKPVKRYRKAAEFEGSEIAREMNGLIDMVDPWDEQLATTRRLGQHAVATAATMTNVDDQIHPAWLLAFNAILVLGLIGYHWFVTLKTGQMESPKKAASKPVDEGGEGTGVRRLDPRLTR